MQELVQCQTQQQESTHEVIKEVETTKQEVVRLKDEMKKKDERAKEDDSKHCLRVETLEALVASRNSELQTVKTENQALKAKH